MVMQVRAVFELRQVVDYGTSIARTDSVLLDGGFGFGVLADEIARRAGRMEEQGYAVTRGRDGGVVFAQYVMHGRVTRWELAHAGCVA